MSDVGARLRAAGTETLLACWAAFARGAPGASVRSSSGVAIAVFPEGPERTVYNNAVLDRELHRGVRSAAIDAVERAYADAGVAEFAVWVHEPDAGTHRALVERGYNTDQSTLAMGMSLDDLRDQQPLVDIAPAGVAAHVRLLGLPGLLHGVADEALHLLVARLDGADVATALAFDHEGDCGIFNVVTREPARRRGIAGALVLRHLHDARTRGCRTATLQSSGMAEHLYRTIGFRDLGRIVEYVPARNAQEYVLRRARADEADRLREIEDEAGTRFAGLGLNDDALDSSYPRDELLPLLALGQVWVACTADDLPVGAVIASVRDGAAYIEELDVVPAHGRRGLGGRLVECVCDWARAEGLPAVALSTFRDVPWNGPFYRRHGFRDLARAEWTADMPAIRETEAQHGLVVEARTFMRRELH